jgi:hypothetical protein
MADEVVLSVRRRAVGTAHQYREYRARYGGAVLVLSPVNDEALKWITA